jgi:hypothetical protein
MSRVLTLVSQYELLVVTASHLSTIDLLNLALTCSQLYNQIRKSEAIFERLKRVALCDGRGLKVRQEYRGLHSIPQQTYGRKLGPSVYRSFFGYARQRTSVNLSIVR